MKQLQTELQEWLHAMGDYFYFLKTERRGFVILMLLSMAILYFPSIYQYWFPKPPPDLEQFNREIALLEGNDDSVWIDQDTLEALPDEIEQASKMEKAKPVPEPFPFDPNTASVADFVQLGLPEYIAQRIDKYRQKGGRFYTPKDFKKIYGIKEEDYQRLEPYISIPSKKKKYPSPEKPSKELVLDINKADTATWQQLHGIGPYYARKIVRFRDALGGFYAIKQIGETWGLPDSVFQKIKPQLQLISSQQQIPIQTCTKEVLRGHPYISYKQARVIIAYRNQHGYITESALNELPVFEEGELDRVLPYLDFGREGD